MEKKKESVLKKLAKEWGIIAAVIATLYFTGLHTEVIGTMQRALLWTGLMDAEQPGVTSTEGPYLNETDYNLRLENADGQQVSLKQFRGKVLFINIWASWCAPCIAEMPTIENLYEKVKDNPNIRFLMISQDADPQKARTFIENKSFTLPYYFLKSNLPSSLQSAYIPATYVVSQEGQIVYEKEGIADYSSEAFRQWFSELAGC